MGGLASPERAEQAAPITSIPIMGGLASPERAEQAAPITSISIMGGLASPEGASAWLPQTIAISNTLPFMVSTIPFHTYI